MYDGCSNFEWSSGKIIHEKIDEDLELDYPLINILNDGNTVKIE